MNKKKILILMTMITITAIVSACGSKKEESAITENETVEITMAESTEAESIISDTVNESDIEGSVLEESTIEESEKTENTTVDESAKTEMPYQDGEEWDDPEFREALNGFVKEQIEKNGDEVIGEPKSATSVERNTFFMGLHIYYSEQAKEAAEALDKLGFGRKISTLEQGEGYEVIRDENGMDLRIYNDEWKYYTKITSKDGETVLWEWEYTDKYEKASLNDN